MTTQQRISFPSTLGPLAGVLHTPDGQPLAWALFAHCFTCSKDIQAAVRIARALVDRGIGVLRFDFTGLGDSEGDFADTTFSSNVSDLTAAAAWLRAERQAPQLLIGHSLGGAAVLAAAEEIPEALAVATIGAPADPAHVAHLLDHVSEEIEASGEAEVSLAGRVFTVRREFLDDIREQRQTERIGRLGRALMVMHAPGDAIVGIENARTIYESARHPKSFVSLDDADHLLTRARDARYVADVIAAWATRYLDSSGATDVGTSSDASLPAGVVEVRGSRARFRNDAQAGSHTFIADEPTSVGGTDLGPGPYDLLLTALGACTSMTMRMYADRKKWPLEHVSVQLTHHREHASDCESCDKTDGHIDIIERTVEIEGDLDPKQRARLAEMADRCPVHRTLHNEIQVRTEFV